ncbi:MAG: FtsH protease activity modulator HflK [Dehalococcoidia bacterium]|nr:FtsH protease activity modulator HflK [Dehalococcoidia bacterium]MSQ17137.1 FtsH protease activity modulator HflK [Dehalococcoidia bacterium]
MYQPGGSRQPELDLEQIFGRFKRWLDGRTGGFGGGGVVVVVVGIIGVIAAIWAATGFYTIGPGEEAALRRFGKVQDPTIGQGGLHWWWPGPVGKRDVVLVTQTRSMQLGFRGAASGARTAFADEALMITGDLNIVDVQMVVQYDIKNLVDFLFRVDDPGEAGRGVPPGQPDGETLKDAAEAALRLVVGQRSIDDVLTEDRQGVEAATKSRLQEILDIASTGINVQTIQLQDVKAPEEVRAAFDDVLQARQERDTKINQARAYENDVLPRAQGQAERIKREAEAFAQTRVERAQGESNRFTSVLKAYQAAREVTRRRLYLEAMEQILAGTNKVIVSPEVESVLVLNSGGAVTPVPLGPSP